MSKEMIKRVAQAIGQSAGQEYDYGLCEDAIHAMALAAIEAVRPSTIELPPLARTTGVLTGSNRWFGDLPETAHGDWPIVITFSRKRDRAEFIKHLRNETCPVTHDVVREKP